MSRQPGSPTLPPDGCVELAFGASVDEFTILNQAELKREDYSNPAGTPTLVTIPLNEPIYDAASKRARFCPSASLPAGGYFHFKLGQGVRGTHGESLAFCAAQPTVDFQTAVPGSPSYTAVAITKMGDFKISSNTLSFASGSAIVVAQVNVEAGFYDFQIVDAGVSTLNAIQLQNTWNEPALFTVTSSTGQNANLLVGPGATGTIPTPF